MRETDEELKVCKSEVVFTKVAEAADYRKTLSRERQDKVAAIPNSDFDKG